MKPLKVKALSLFSERTIHVGVIPTTVAVFFHNFAIAHLSQIAAIVESGARVAKRVGGYIVLLDEEQRFGFLGVPYFGDRILAYVADNELRIPVKLFAHSHFAIGQDVKSRE